MSVLTPRTVPAAIVVFIESEDLNNFTLVCKDWHGAAVHSGPRIFARFKVVRGPNVCLLMEYGCVFTSVAFEEENILSVYGYRQLGFLRPLICN